MLRSPRCHLVRCCRLRRPLLRRSLHYRLRPCRPLRLQRMAATRRRMANPPVTPAAVAPTVPVHTVALAQCRVAGQVGRARLATPESLTTLHPGLEAAGPRMPDTAVSHSPTRGRDAQLGAGAQGDR